MAFNMIYGNKVETEVLEEIEGEIDLSLEKSLILWNDDKNTFNWVEQTLMEVCGHDEIQAKQCSFLIHHKGKCSVKHGSYNTLKPMKEEIIFRGINATIE